MASPITFIKAEKSQAKLRLAILGPTGAGKTYTALAITEGRKVAVIDTEHGSAAKYADRFAFDVLNLTEHHPQNYIDAIKAAEQAGYDVAIIDSMTHAWTATKELVDQETFKSKSGNSFQAWGKVTPLWNDLIQAIVSSKIHVIATMRSKIEWVVEENERGKKTPRKIGTKPENRDGAEYEFDVVIELDQDHRAWASKTRCADIDGKTWERPGAADLGASLFGWLEAGAVVPAQAAARAAVTRADTAPAPTWTPEQRAEATSIAAAITAHGPLAVKDLARLRADLKASCAIDAIDALGALASRWDDIASQAQEGAK
jgi:KaiC/GvpD/RAD55 family RecA-like ATPase